MVDRRRFSGAPYMLSKILIGAAASVSALVVLPATASAQPYYGDGYRGHRSGYVPYRPGDYYEGRNYRRGYVRHHARGYGQAYYGRGYGQAYYGRPYRGNYRCSDGTTGAIVGGAAGALLGREVARGGRHRYRRGGDGTVGAIIGGAVGALVGREVDRGC